eukprot:PITA_24814
MQINHRKSQLIMTGLVVQERGRLHSVLPFQPSTLELPFKYLGFWLKPNDYKKEDWNWLIAKIESRISHWSFKWLSRAGRLTLIKAVLLAIPVYWATLTWVPKGTMDNIRRLCSRFLWDGSKENSVLPWVGWDKVARPKDWGGWGIKNLPDFSLSLAAKLGWRLIKMDNLWTRVLKRKYIDPVPLEEWIRNPIKSKQHASVIWKATVDSFKVIEQGLAWKIGNDRNLKIGKDPWIGCNENYALSPGLIRHLEDKNILTLYQWKRWVTQVFGVKHGKMERNYNWIKGGGMNGLLSLKNSLAPMKGWGEPEWWAKQIWKLKCPAKARIFLWCLLKKKFPSWDILQSRFMYGPGRCPLCKIEEESINHLFLQCLETAKIWREVEKLLNKSFQWGNGNLDEAWSNWWQHYPNGNLRNLPPTICWGVWLARNRAIFQDQGTQPSVIAIQAVSIFSSIPEPEEKRPQIQNKTMHIKDGIPWAFFDGASQNNIAGAGIVIHINANHSLKASVGLGSGTNNFAELSALRLLLCWLIQRNTFTIQIFGDSLNAINWVNGKSSCKNQILKPMLEELQVLKSSFNSFSICHIYRDNNDDADKLPKEGLQQALGGWKIVEDCHGQIHASDVPSYL